MNEMPVTAVLAAGLSIWMVILSWDVVKYRRIAGVSIGDDDNGRLRRKIRAQANLTEYAPLFTILIGLCELHGANAWVIAALALVFGAGRIAHGYALAFTEKNVIGRVGGMALTFAAIIIASVLTVGMLALG